MTESSVSDAGSGIRLEDIPYRSLSRADKITLSELLWEDLDYEDPTPYVRESHLKLVRERVAFREANPMPTIPLDVAIKQAEKALAALSGN